MAKLTKRQQKVNELLEGFEQPSTIKAAVEKLQEVSKAVAKFDETVECHMRLGIDVKHADQQIRSTVVLPAGLGKEVRVCVIAKGAKVTEATEAGADYAGTEDIIDKCISEFAPNYLAKYLLNLSTLFNSFYAKEKVLCEDPKERNTKLYLIKEINDTLVKGMKLLGMSEVDKM